MASDLSLTTLAANAAGETGQVSFTSNSSGKQRVSYYSSSSLPGKQDMLVLPHITSLRRAYPLNLSISVSGGRESKSDSLSSGERKGKSPPDNLLGYQAGVGLFRVEGCVYMLSIPSGRPTRDCYVTDKSGAYATRLSLATEGESP